MALRFDICLVQSNGCNRFIINYDNLEVIETAKSGDRSAEVALVVFYDCYHVACDFARTFKHCNREAKKVAHELAMSVRYNISGAWLEEPQATL